MLFGELDMEPDPIGLAEEPLAIAAPPFQFHRFFHIPPVDSCPLKGKALLS